MEGVIEMSGFWRVFEGFPGLLKGFSEVFGGSVGEIIAHAAESLDGFLNDRPAGIAVGGREMDQSRDGGDRGSRSGIRWPSDEAPAK